MVAGRDLDERNCLFVIIYVSEIFGGFKMNYGTGRHGEYGKVYLREDQIERVNSK